MDHSDRKLPSGFKERLNTQLILGHDYSNSCFARDIKIFRLEIIRESENIFIVKFRLCESLQLLEYKIKVEDILKIDGGVYIFLKSEHEFTIYSVD